MYVSLQTSLSPTYFYIIIYIYIKPWLVFYCPYNHFVPLFLKILTLYLRNTLATAHGSQ